MEWQQIVGFWHVAQSGSFTKAAEATYRTQSALSQQVKALEEELGCQLLERIGKRQVKLTAAGEVFLAFAVKIRDEHEQLQETLTAVKGRQQGRLRLAAPFTTLFNLLPEVVQRYRTQFPYVQLTILDRPQERVIQSVQAGEVDFGFALETIVPADLATRRWRQVQTVLLVPPNHPLTAAEPITWEEIARHPLILPPATKKYSHRQMLEEYLRKTAKPYQVVMESANVELSYIYAALGLGVAFATVVKGFPLHQRQEMVLLPLEQYFPADWLVMVWRRDKNLAALKAAFLEMITSQAQGNHE